MDDFEDEMREEGDYEHDDGDYDQDQYLDDPMDYEEPTDADVGEEEVLGAVEGTAVEEPVPAEAALPTPTQPKGKGPVGLAWESDDDEHLDDDENLPVANGAQADVNGEHVGDTSMDVDENEGLEDQEEEEDEEEEDEIVREIDVFFAGNLAESLYIFQYPTRPHAFTDDYHPVAGRFKRKAQKFELDIPLDTYGPHYNQDAGKTLGEGTHDIPLPTASERRDERPAVLLQKQTLSSSLLPSHAKYMVGVFAEDELHLTPVNATLQLRPSLQYIDKMNEKKRATTQRANAELRKEEDPSYEDEGKLVQLAVRALEDKEGAKKAIAQQMEEEIEREQWVDMDVFGVQTDESLSKAAELFSWTKDELECKTSGDQYLDDIHPRTVMAEKKKDEKILVRRGIPLADMAVLALPDQLRALLLNAHVVSFTSAVKLLKLPAQEDEIVTGLQEVAILVNGAWVIRSELLYSGRALDARRYLLSLFQEHGTVDRSKFGEFVKLSPEMTKNMLSEIAFLREDRRWELKVPPDDEFLEGYPDVVRSQATVVQDEATSAMQALEWVVTKDEKRESKSEGSGSRPGSGSKAGPSNGKATATAARPTFASKKSAGSVQGATKDQQLKHIIGGLFKDAPICSLAFILRTVAARVKDDDKCMLTPTDITEAKIKVLVNKLCFDLDEGGYMMRIVGDPKTDKYRPALAELFKSKREVRKADVTKACKEHVGDEPAAGVYQSLMRTLCTSKPGSQAWVLKESK
ncbi:DNA-directed RNA polymerase III subunit RPC5 [Rhizophlyctis rosea]|nr:DNA-directed RNA polymerase III subunit RPC5 [Rhizophlyctis rosea]